MKFESIRPVYHTHIHCTYIVHPYVGIHTYIGIYIYPSHAEPQYIVRLKEEMNTLANDSYFYKTMIALSLSLRFYCQ